MCQKGECVSIMTLSIIIPYFNSSKYLHKCIEHLCSQTISDKLELIFVDDGSTDDSTSVIKGILNKSNFSGKVSFLYHAENYGVAYSRKEGIENATGDYLIFCDSDDWMEDDMCEKMLSLAVSGGYDMVVCDYVNDYVDRVSYVSDNCYIEPFLRNLLLCKVTGALWNKMVKRSIYFSNDFVFPSHSFCEDYVYSVQFAIYCRSIAYFPEPKYHYCHRSGSIVNASSKQAIDQRIEDNLCNYQLVESILSINGLKSRYDSEIIALKLIIKNSILNYIHQKHYYRRWLKIFPEMSKEIFQSRDIPLRSQIKYIITLLGVYPLFVKLRVAIKCQR